MDNVTHTMIGLIAGETVFEHSDRRIRDGGAPRGLPARVRRSALVAVAIIGSNLPDVDLLWSYGGSSGNHLRYMLSHRGYTHTVLGCAALAALLYGCAEVWLRIRRVGLSAVDRALLFGTAFMTTALHLAMDYLNSYGVHPYWPVDDHWRYGDSVFIVEPLYWVAAAPLFRRLESRLSRALFVSAIAVVVALGAATRLLSVGSCAVLLIGALALDLLGRRMSAVSASRLSVGVAVSVTLAFVWAGQVAAQHADALAQELFGRVRDGAGRALDHVLTPMPVNPMCWDVWLLGTRGERYIARHVVLSIAPMVEKASACPASVEPHTARLTPVPEQNSDGLRWMGEYSTALPELLRQATSTCDANAFMQFARAPFSSTKPRTLLGDLRFDRGRERGSFEVGLDEPSPAVASDCPRTPPWIAPRADLFATPELR